MSVQDDISMRFRASARGRVFIGEIPARNASRKDIPSARTLPGDLLEITVIRAMVVIAATKSRFQAGFRLPFVVEVTFPPLIAANDREPDKRIDELDEADDLDEKATAFRYRYGA